MAYPLMFPTGQPGWQHNTIKLNFPDNEQDEQEQLSDFFSEVTDEQEDIALIQEQENLVFDEEVLENQETFEEKNEGPIQNIDPDTNSNLNKKKMKFVSAMQYYRYLLCDRPGSYLHRYGRLFHQFICDQFSKIELGRLNFFRFNQDKIRADLYQNVKDSDPNALGESIGLRKILPSTYQGKI